MIKKILFSIAVLLLWNIALCQNKAVMYLNAVPGEDACSQVGINWQCTRPGSYLELKNASDVSFERARKIFPLEKEWSLGSDFESEFNKPRYVCSVNLSRLKKNHRYEYRVVCDGTPGETYTFSTASGKDKWTFAAFTDFQPAFNEKTHAIIDKVVSLSDAPVPLVVCSGDMTDYSTVEDEWRWVFEGCHFSKGLYASSPGDHEYWGKGELGSIPQLPLPLVYNSMFNFPKNGLEERLNSCYYFIFNNVLFVSLDMADSNTPRCDMFSREAEWFSTVVESLKGKYEFLVVLEHKGIFGSYTNDSGVAKYMRPLWAPVFRKAGVDLVLCGHDHMFSRSVCIGGTYYLDMGTSGAKTRTPDDGLYNDGLHEIVLDLKASRQCMGALIDVSSNSLSVRVYELDGSLIDKFSIQR